MGSKWLSPFVYTKTSQDLNFKSFHSEKSPEELHFYSPWNQEKNPELLYKIKQKIVESGSCKIDLNLVSGKHLDISLAVMTIISNQIKDGKETHLVLSNLDSIHVYRVCEFELNGDGHTLFVDDVFVLSAHEDNGSCGVSEQLTQFVERGYTEKIFATHSNKSFDFKWSLKERSITFEYYIASKELQENIYKDCWQYLTKSAQHELVGSTICYHQSLFLPHLEKWISLEETFSKFKSAAYIELNDLYIEKLCLAINTSRPLAEAWRKFRDHYPENDFTITLDKLIKGEIALIEEFNQFNIYIDGIKNFLFFLKQYFSKNLVNEESLFIESFISNHEQLVEPYRLIELREILSTYNEIEHWIGEVTIAYNQNLIEQVTQRECNLKLSGLINSISSLDPKQNILLKLLKEKSSSHIPKQTLEGQVKGLFNIDLKKAA